MKNFEDFLSEASRPPMDERGIEARGEKALRDIQGRRTELEDRMERGYSRVNSERSRAAARKRASNKARGDQIIQDIRDEKKKSAIVKSPGGKMELQPGKGRSGDIEKVKAGGRTDKSGQSRPPSAKGSKESAGEPRNPNRRVPTSKSIVPTKRDEKKKSAIVKSPGGKMELQPGKGRSGDIEKVKAGGRADTSGQSRPPSAKGSKEKAGEQRARRGNVRKKSAIVPYKKDSSAITASDQKRNSGSAENTKPQKIAAIEKEKPKTKPKSSFNRELRNVKKWYRRAQGVAGKLKGKKQSGEISRGGNLKGPETENTQIQ